MYYTLPLLPPFCSTLVYNLCRACLCLSSFVNRYCTCIVNTDIHAHVVHAQIFTQTYTLSRVYISDHLITCPPSPPFIGKGRGTERKMKCGGVETAGLEFWRVVDPRLAHHWVRRQHLACCLRHWRSWVSPGFRSFLWEIPKEALNSHYPLPILTCILYV